MQRPMWAPEDVDITKPSVARIYDCLLGGFHNFEADRLVAEKVIEAIPLAPWMARMNRAFLGRAVKYYLDVGITQFLDLGSGLPSRGSVHEIAQNYNSDTRVLYVDHDPIAVTHCQLILKNNPNANTLYADIRQPKTVLNAPETTQLLDFTKPIGILMIAVFQLVPDSDNPAGIIAGYHRKLAPGSYLALSHPSDNDDMKNIPRIYPQHLSAQITPRNRTDIETLLAGFELVPPGVTWIEDWHPEPGTMITEGTPTRFMYGVVARKP